MRYVVLVSCAAALLIGCKNDPPCRGGFTFVSTTPGSKLVTAHGTFQLGLPLMTLQLPSGGEQFPTTSHTDTTAVFDLGSVASGSYAASWQLSCTDATIAINGPSLVMVP
ncbi:MAG: hypothetical protein ACREL5_06150 [Gemmatimonadales bacterium]